MRDGADHLMTVEYDTKRMTTCPIRAVEKYIAVGTALGWNMTQGYLFPRISRRPNTGAPIRGKTPISAPDMTKALKVHARNAGERIAFTMHSFRSGGALTRDLAGEDLPTVMQRTFWKKPSTAWRYLRLMEVLIPGSIGNSMVTGVSQEQYRESERVISLYCSGDTPATIDFPTDPGISTSISLRYLQAVLSFFQNARCITVGRSSPARSRVSAPPDLKECMVNAVRSPALRACTLSVFVISGADMGVFP